MILSNPRWELFAQFRAGGKSCAEAYRLAGFSEKGASQSGNRLDKTPEIAERISELQSLTAEIPAAANWLNRNYVLEKLRQVIDKAMDAGKFGDVVSSARLLGLEVGLFREKVDHTVWDGNPATLTEAQRNELVRHLEHYQFGGDPVKAREARRAALLEAGEPLPPELETLDVPSEGVSESETEPK